MNAGADPGAGQCQVLPQIEPLRQFAHGVLARQDFVTRRRHRQPAGERLLAGLGACDGKQLEERRRTENIEVVGIQVVVIAKPFPVLTGADPAILDPGQPPFVERDGSFGVVPRP